jgi:hypothetical protein
MHHFSDFDGRRGMTVSAHSAAPHHLPAFIAAPGETDVLMVGVAVFLVVAVLMVGILFLRLHTLPERMAHKGHKLQFEIVAVLGLLALFTHVHLFWVAGLLLALIDIPDFSGSFARMAGSLEKIADKPESVIQAPHEPISGTKSVDRAAVVPGGTITRPPDGDGADGAHDGAGRFRNPKEPIHA